MAEKKLPLKEISIDELFSGSERTVYEIPIYQRNYAWENDEISALVQDVYDAYKKDEYSPYYIGTLVSYHKGDRVFEIIDGQQRLTTIRILLDALGIPYTNQLTYRARKKSDDTLKSIPNFNVDEKDYGIENGYRYAKSAIGEILPNEDRAGFISYFKSNVHIIHYQVPKDIDLNHYFEIMNSRGEQLEKHEIVKANLMEKLADDEERKVFNRIWECCSEMSVYTQQNLRDFQAERVFGRTLYDFQPRSFDDLMFMYRDSKKDDEDNLSTITIADIIRNESNRNWEKKEETEKKDSFQPIIDFPNFLLTVLKITRMDEPGFVPADFTLDDKELLNEFRSANMDAGRIRTFACNLLKARFLLDNYIVHHSKEEDTLDSNPWKLQVWYRDPETNKGRLKNLIEERRPQDKLAHLLSMFEVSFTARQRKNYLFYCLYYLMNESSWDTEAYTSFVENLADRYFLMVYLDGSKLNAINTPIPGSFDDAILDGHRFNTSDNQIDVQNAFVDIYGDGTEASKGVPLFIFNYLDYKLWNLYDSDLRGEQYKEGSREREAFFEKLGCSDFGLKVFDQFYFSRTRRSLEHYYAQALATGKDGALDQDQINCLGNYAMIGSEANSSGSNWSPKTKLDHYLDSSGKISQISVASLKFMIMMQMCRDDSKWEFEEIISHQNKMLEVLIDGNGVSNQKPDHGIVERSDEEIRTIGREESTDRSEHIMDIIKEWAKNKETSGELIAHPGSCTKKYYRFTTKVMSDILPDAPDARSGWKTRNHYFYEIMNTEGKTLRTQLAFSGHHIPDDLKDTCDKISEIFPSSRKDKNWKWRLPVKSKTAKLSESISVEAVKAILEEQFNYIMECEKYIVRELTNKD